MARDVIFGAQFTESKLGKTGLTVTFNVYRVTLSDLSLSTVVTGGSATAVGQGLYIYKLSSADLQLYYYFAVASTATTSVDQREIPAVHLDWVDRSEGVTASTVSDKAGYELTSGERSSVATAVWAAGSRTLTSFGTLVADIWASITRTLTAQSDSDGTTTLLSRLTDTRAGHLDSIPDIASDVAGIDTKLGAPAGASVSADVAEIYSNMLLPANANRTVQITGSNHIAADIHELQAGVITAGDFAANSITASALASDAVSEIQSGLSTLDAAGVRAAVGLASANLDTQLASIETNTNDLPTLIENDGQVNARFTETALSQAPAGGGGGGGSVSLTVNSPSREVEATDSTYVLLASDGETVEVSIRGGAGVSSQKGWLVFAASAPQPNEGGTFEEPGAFLASSDQATQRYALDGINLYGRARRRGATVTFVVNGELV